MVAYNGPDSMTLQVIADVIGAKLPEGIDGTQVCSRVLTQRNYVQPGDVVISAGWYFHDLVVPESLQNGALAVFCNQEVKESFPEENVIAVDDALECVTRFQTWRAQGCNAKRIAITGSVGKTTTTGLINAIVAKTYNTLTHHTMSNSHGAILRNTQKLSPAHEYWVQEVGGIHPGYVESSARFLRPDIVVLTNIGYSHLDTYVTRENIFHDKSSLERYAQPDAVVVINYDDDMLREATYTHRLVTCSKENPAADYYGKNIRTELDGVHFTVVCKDGECDIHLNLYGEHNVYNALSAIAVGRLVGVSLEQIAKLLEQYRPNGMRQNMVEAGGYRFLVDTFNAEPATVLGAAVALTQIPVPANGRKVFVSGHIDKLGEDSAAMHEQLGHDLAKLDLDSVALFAGDAKYTYQAMLEEGCTNVFFTEDRNVLDAWLRANLKKTDVIFFKSGQFKAALAKSIDHVFGTSFQNEQQANEGKTVQRDGFRFRLRQDNIAELLGYSGEETHVVIPATYDGYVVTRIAPFAFRRNRSLVSITIPDTVTTIGREAFYICPKLKSVQLPKNLLFIDKNAFNYCISLEYVVIPRGTLHIGRHAFFDCVSLQTVILPSTVGYLGEGVFEKAGSLNLQATLVCDGGSYAQTYAVRKGLKYITSEQLQEILTDSGHAETKENVENQASAKQKHAVLQKNELKKKAKKHIKKYVVALKKSINKNSKKCVPTNVYKEQQRQSANTHNNAGESTSKSLTSSQRRLLDRANYWKRQYHKRVSEESTLTAEQKDMIQALWGGYQDLFEIDSVYHDFYYQKTGVFDARFAPVDLYYCYIDPYYNNWDMAPVLDNKCLYSRLFKDIRQPEIVCCRMNGIWVDAEMQLLNDEALQELLLRYDEVVIKQANESEGGSNVFFVSGEHKTEQFFESCKSIEKDIVVQAVIKQHEVLNRVNPSSVNTIRVLSLLRQDEVTICSAILRMGINGSRVDNLSRGGIACGVGKDGRLTHRAYNSFGVSYEIHPTTQISFDSIVLPNFDKVCELVKRAHPSIPHFRLVSWDVAIEESGEPLLVEANLCYGELNLHQLNNGPIFGKQTEAILQEVFKK